MKRFTGADLMNDMIQVFADESVWKKNVRVVESGCFSVSPKGPISDFRF